MQNENCKLCMQCFMALQFLKKERAMTDLVKQRKLLKDLRSKLVGANKTLPYTIYRDKDIEALLKAQPKTLEDLGKIKGFPFDGIRHKNYGESILKVFTDPDSIATFELDTSKPEPVIKTVARKVYAFL